MDANWYQTYPDIYIYIYIYTYIYTHTYIFATRYSNTSAVLTMYVLTLQSVPWYSDGLSHILGRSPSDTYICIYINIFSQRILVPESMTVDVTLTMTANCC